MYEIVSRLQNLEKMLETYPTYRGPTRSEPKDMTEVYTAKKYKFPEWSIDLAKSRELCTEKICFYDKDDDIEQVKRVLLEREPVNIEMERDLYFLISRNELATSLKPSFTASIELPYSLGDGSFGSGVLRNNW